MSNLIKDTTKEERMKKVRQAMAITAANNEFPSDEVLQLAKKYVDGELELDEVTNLVIKKYKRTEK